MSKHEPTQDAARDPVLERAVLEREVLDRLVLDQRPGPAARISSARANAMVQAALDSALDSALVSSEPSPPAQLPASRGARLFATGLFSSKGFRALAMAAGALLVLVGGAAAAKRVVEVLWPQAQPAIESVPAAPRTAAPAARAPLPALADELELATEEQAPESLPAASAAPERSAVRRSARETEALFEDRLQQANRARAAGDFRKAAALYTEVYERHPDSLPAYVAQVAAASIELEHLSRPERAARLFRKALRERPGGALDLEARQGLSIALRDLGRTREEAEVLRGLIAAHPGRPAEARARVRLAELSAARPAR